MAKQGKIKKDHVAVLLEAIKADFRAFGESLDFVKKDLKEIKQKLERIEEKLDEKVSRIEFESIKQRVGALEKQS